MNIIFGHEQAQELSNKYTVLELDAFQFGENGPVISAYCTVETVPFSELPELEATKQIHDHLLINYRGRDWNNCLLAIQQLTGKWRGELDTFYADLEARIQNYIKNPPPAEWSHIIQKATS